MIKLKSFWLKPKSLLIAIPMSILPIFLLYKTQILSQATREQL